MTEGGSRMADRRDNGSPVDEALPPSAIRRPPSGEARRTLAAALLVMLLALALYAIHPAFFVKDDFQLQYLPGSREVARAWMAGDYPLLSRFSWLCAGLGAEYQFGVFSIVRSLLDVLVWLLPLSLTGRGAFLFIVHAAIAAAGGYRLARTYGASVSSSMLVALVAGLNGWILWWGTTWYPGVASFAWLPWYWAALRTIESRRSWLVAPVALYLLVASGWPYSVAMAAAVAAMNFFGALAQRRWRASLLMVAASALGLMLAAPAVLMLLEYWPSTARTTVATLVEREWFLPPLALFGLVVPSFSVEWTVFAGRFPHAAVELLGAFVPLAAVLAALLMTGRRDFVKRHAPELLLLVALLVLLLLPSAGPFRWSFRWLPLFLLLLAVIGANALDVARKRAALFAGALVILTAIASLMIDAERTTTLTHVLVLGALCVAWWFFEKPMPVAITVIAIVLTFIGYSHRSEVPMWAYDESLRAPGPFDPSRRYLALYDMGTIGEADEWDRFSRGLNSELRPGNIPMLAGIDFINGYSPLGLTALINVFMADTHGPVEPKQAELMLENETAPNQLLHHLGIDGLVVPEAMVRKHAPLLARNGWHPAARIGPCLVLHRTQPANEPLFSASLAFKAKDETQAYAAMFGRRTPHLPVVLLVPGAGRGERYGRRELVEITEARNHTSFVVRGHGPKALIVFRRPWLPGWRATLNGEPLPVLRANMVMPAVEIPADAQGEVRLVYRPKALLRGALLAGVALLVIALVFVRWKS